MASVKVLVSFDGFDGNSPSGRLVLDAGGNLLGTTRNGNTVFEVLKTAAGYSGTPTVLATLADGSGPSGGLLIDRAGNLLGVTQGGGPSNQESVFELARSGNSYAGTTTTVAGFGGSELIADAAGNLLGVTGQGGSAGQGTVFELPATGTGYSSTPVILASFGVGNLFSGSGTNPVGPLLRDGAGNLFGTTAGLIGTIYEIPALPGGGGQIQTLARFASLSAPNSGLIEDAAGNLFGTTYDYPGSPSYGTVYELVRTPAGYAGTPTTLASFSLSATSGRFPNGPLLMDAAGNLFGTTSMGGANDRGTVFEVARTATGYAGTATTLATFDDTNGAYPVAGLIADAAGNLFGTTYGGGGVSIGYGTVFEIENTGFFTPACYCRGTRILTPRGEVAIEDLVAGDDVVTESGAAEVVRWMGRRSYAGRFLSANPGVQPVRFHAGALGGGLPRRDLLVSPDHAVLLDGVLVPARQLVNGTTVVRERGLGQVEYFHVELDRHDVLLAEGAAAESFVDDDSRGVFGNAAEWARAHPDRKRVPAVFCAPRVESGPALEAIRRRLDEVPGGIGRVA